MCSRGPARALPSFSAPAKKMRANGVSLTSMIDVMVVLVVFMLVQFYAPDPCACIRRRVNVPTVEQAMEIIDAPLVSVTNDVVLVDGMPVATKDDLAGDRVQRLDGMFQLLASKHALARQIDPGKAPPSHVILAIDGEVPSLLVKSVTMTAAQSGYPDIDFMVATN
ncbi:MAG TPA: biopolymer transporter ExbD [Labilithrix sp.]